MLNRKQRVEHISLIPRPRVERGLAGFSVYAESVYCVTITFLTGCIQIYTWLLFVVAEWKFFDKQHQEHIEPALPTREHVTIIDGKIQAWLPDANFSNIQIWKGSNVHMHTCVIFFHTLKD